MTASHSRDPRLRRRADVRSPLEAAVALEVAADRMRAGLRSPEPEPVYPDPERIDPAVRSAIERWDTAAAVVTGAEEAVPYRAPTVDDPGTGTGPNVIPPPFPGDDEPTEEPETDDGPYWDPARYVAGGQTHQQPAPSLPLAAQAPDQHVSPQVFETEHPRVAWRSKHDPRSLAFGVSRVLRGSGPLQRVELPTGPVLDQTLAGATVEEQSCCTGCGIVATRNVLSGGASVLDISDAEAIYERAKVIDAVPGEDYAGTSVLAALQAAQEQGLIGGYLWCFGTRHIAQTLIQRRLPVVVGVRWYEGMWETGPGGLVKVEGDDVGLGHVLTVVGLELKGPQGQPGPYFRWQNSIGTGYGDGGFGWIHHRDLSQLLAGAGEAAVPTLDPQTPQ